MFMVILLDHFVNGGIAERADAVLGTVGKDRGLDDLPSAVGNGVRVGIDRDRTFIDLGAAL